MVPSAIQLLDAGFILIDSIMLVIYCISDLELLERYGCYSHCLNSTSTSENRFLTQPIKECINI